MSYCPSCGQAIQDGAKFCASCGAPVSGTPQSTQPGAAAASTPHASVVVVEPKRGGWLAFKGFLAAIIISGVMSFVTLKDRSVGMSGALISYGIGAAYIITNLRKWKRNNEIIRGEAIAWTVAVFLLVACLGALITAWIGNSGTTVSSPAGSGTSVDPKEVLFRDVKLGFTWSKQGFDNVMVANFTVENPTQYRFKDFEIKCTHSAPSGTEIDSNTRTVYEVVEPRSTKIIKQMNMGFIHSQATRSGCQITDLVVVP